MRSPVVAKTKVRYEAIEHLGPDLEADFQRKKAKVGSGHCDDCECGLEITCCGA